MIQDSRPDNKTLYHWVMFCDGGHTYDKGEPIPTSEFPSTHPKYKDLYFPIAVENKIQTPLNLRYERQATRRRRKIKFN